MRDQDAVLQPEEPMHRDACYYIITLVKNTNTYSQIQIQIQIHISKYKYKFANINTNASLSSPHCTYLILNVVAGMVSIIIMTMCSCLMCGTR